MNRVALFTSNLCLGLAGVTVGAVCAFMAYSNGTALAHGTVGVALGAAFAAVVVGNWFLLPRAAMAAAAGDKHHAAQLRVGWVFCLVFVLINAVGFTARHRGENVGVARVAANAYEDNRAALVAARQTLETMKQNPRFVSTSGCTNATVEASIRFCQDEFRPLRERIARYERGVSHGRPGTVDPQAETVAWVLQASPSTVGRAIPILWAVIMDFAAILFISAALRPTGVRTEKPKTVEAVKVAEVVAEPEQTAPQCAKAAPKKTRRILKEGFAPVVGRPPRQRDSSGRFIRVPKKTMKIRGAAND